MTCRRYVDLMTEYMEGDLSDADQELWEAHFEGCPGCKTFFTGFKNSIELVNHLETQGCPTEVKKRVQSILAARAERGGQSQSKG